MPLNLTSPNFQQTPIQAGGVVAQLPTVQPQQDQNGLSQLGAALGGLLHHITNNPTTGQLYPNQQKLNQDGINALNGNQPAPSGVMQTAQSMIGLNQNTDNSALRSFFQKSGEGQLDPSKTPWCAGFANAVLNSNHIAGTNSLAATSFLNWGNPTKNPQKGDVVVVDYHNGHGHVGFFDGYDKNGNVQILGGNSGGGKVGISTFSPDKIAGYRTAPSVGELMSKGVPAPQGGTATPANPILDKSMDAIAKVETGDSKDPYNEVTNAGGGRSAIGKYQILNTNIPSWTKAATGHAYSPAQFKKNPQLQDTTARYIMNQYIKQYKNADDVASMWFSGRPASQSQDLKDNTGTSGKQYINLFRKFYNSTQDRTDDNPNDTPSWDILGTRG